MRQHTVQTSARLPFVIPAPIGKRIRVARALLLLLPLILVTPCRALGYADPGTGAFVYQAIYAAFLGGSFYLRKLLDRFWGKRK
jgi:hypothetical protein